ncbi:alanine:cation symporter family protein, partial [Peptoniphilus sp.]|uniref:alanine:cation symporter family protein n=1 Tax=Peptoniphilus sp. TaxID=1971214 RepID=UPI003D8A63B5
MESFANLTDFLSGTIYTYILIPLLLGLGLYFTIRIKGGQIRNIGHAVKLITKKSENKDAISPFKAFTISAASHIGTGNIVGVAAAISIGGPGAVFWMWITALLGGASSF